MDIQKLMQMFQMMFSGGGLPGAMGGGTPQKPAGMGAPNESYALSKGQTAPLYAAPAAAGQKPDMYRKAPNPFMPGHQNPAEQAMMNPNFMSQIGGGKFDLARILGGRR